MLNQNESMATCCGRAITRRELGEIQETIALFGNLSRKELTHTICEHLDWRTPSGTNKWDACLNMLKLFEKKGYLTLPQKQKQTKPNTIQVKPSPRTDPEPSITCKLKELGKIRLIQTSTRDQTLLWNEYTARYHYLGYKKPFGYSIRYFLQSPDHLLGCLLFSGAAKAIGPRDKWIGWSNQERLQNLAWVINNSRFLIFPWVKVKNLASHVLGQACRQISEDWQRKWGFSPALMETFVDPKYYPGTSYKAANWIHIGMTTGKGLVRKNKSYETSPKKIFVKPITPHFRQQLCTHKPKGEKK